MPKNLDKLQHCRARREAVSQGREVLHRKCRRAPAYAPGQHGRKAVAPLRLPASSCARSRSAHTYGLPSASSQHLSRRGSGQGCYRERLLAALESRPRNITYRMGFGASRGEGGSRAPQRILSTASASHPVLPLRPAMWWKSHRGDGASAHKAAAEAAEGAVPGVARSRSKAAEGTSRHAGAR